MACLRERNPVWPTPGEPLPLPSYPFSRNDYALPATAEAFNAYGKTMQSDQRHPLLGARMADGSPEWRALIDPQLVPYLDDHRVDGGVIVPAAGLIEMGLAAGRDLFGDVPLELDEFDVLKALAIAEDETREGPSATRLAPPRWKSGAASASRRRNGRCMRAGSSAR